MLSLAAQIVHPNCRLTFKPDNQSLLYLLSLSDADQATQEKAKEMIEALEDVNEPIKGVLPLVVAMRNHSFWAVQLLTTCAKKVIDFDAMMKFALVTYDTRSGKKYLTRPEGIEVTKCITKVEWSARYIFKRMALAGENVFANEFFNNKSLAYTSFVYQQHPILEIAMKKIAEQKLDVHKEVEKIYISAHVFVSRL